MKIYFAGSFLNSNVTALTSNILKSYLVDFNKNPDKLKKLVTSYNIKNLFLDSGAFSAFTQKAVIDIDEYISFCKEIESFVKVISNLDVIGNPEATLKNWVYMKSKGVNALPVIHYGANEKYFKIYFEDYKCQYVALGGLVPYARKKNKLLNWLDYSFSLIKKYFPVKIHLFGITSSWVLKRYPVYSCDSTSWLNHSNFGVNKKYENLNMVNKQQQMFHSEQNYKVNFIKHIEEYIKLQREITKMWEYRGIKFN